ncbi:uncharacterized protein LOC134435318 [Engraulis encrasicolus]|uniref:uncharacterized protein LOC134435318 n=1 Tax=Engraulis encrasicolus TaxID=184585 RepID=UPI002FD0EBB0
MKKGSKDPSQNPPGPASGLDLAGSPGSSLPFPVEEYILNLSEEEWKAFSNMLETPMTRSQFVELSKTVLKVFSLGSFRLVLPTLIHRGFDELKSDSDTSSRSGESGNSSEGVLSGSSSYSYASGSACASSSATADGPMLWMKCALAAFRKRVAWLLPRHSPDVHSYMSDIHADSDKRSACPRSRSGTRTEPRRGIPSVHVEDFGLLPDVHSYMSDIHADSDKRSACPRSRSGTRTEPRRGIPSVHVEDFSLLPDVHSYMSDIHADSDKRSACPRSRSGTRTEPRRGIPSVHVEDFGLLPDVRSYMSDIHADSDKRSACPRSRSGTRTEPRRGIESVHLEDFGLLLDRLFSNEAIDRVVQELVGQVQVATQDGGPSGVPATVTVPEAVYANTEQAIKNLLRPYVTPLVVCNSPGTTVPNIARFTELLLAELENCHSAAVLGAEDDVRASTSHSVDQSCQSRTASLKTDTETQESSSQNGRQRMFGLFSQLMVHQVMDKMHEDSAAQQEQESVRGSSTAASLLLGDTKDFGCFVTVLLLRLLARMSDGCPCCGAKRLDQDLLQKLIEDLLFEFTSDPWCPSFDGDLSNQTIPSIYRAMDAVWLRLLKQFGSDAILWRAVDTQDNSFDATLLAELRKELLTQRNVEDPAEPSTQSDSPSLSPVPEPSTQSDLPSLSPVPEVTSGQTARKARSKLKIFKIRSSAKIAPTKDASDKGLESEATVTRALSDEGIAAAPSGDRKEPRRRPWYKKIFLRLSCFGGPAEI